MAEVNYEKYAEDTIYFGEYGVDAELSKAISERMKKEKIVSLLDIGAGDGQHLFALAKQFPKLRLFALDISKTRIDRIKEKLKKRLAGGFVEDICRTKIKSSSFDVVTSDQVIEHVDSDEKMVGEIKRILKKGGFFRVSSVYKKWYGWYFYRCNNKWVLDPTHVREYSSVEEYRKLFMDKGLFVKSVRVDPINFSVVDFVLRRLKIKTASRGVEKFRKAFASLNIPKPGYYIITITGTKS